MAVNPLGAVRQEISPGAQTFFAPWLNPAAPRGSVNIDRAGHPSSQLPTQRGTTPAGLKAQVGYPQFIAHCKTLAQLLTLPEWMVGRDLHVGVETLPPVVEGVAATSATALAVERIRHPSPTKGIPRRQ
jgi:hypothetical protein